MRLNLINLRKEKGLTQMEIAKNLNISTRHYRRLETGASNGSIKIWSKLQQILNVDTIDFLLEQEANCKKT